MDGLPAGDELRESLIEIDKAAERASLTGQLLTFSRNRLFEAKTVVIFDVVRDFEKMLRRIIREDIDLSFNLDRKGGAIRTVAGQVEQIIVNLAVNARDAMPHDGRLVVEWKYFEVDAQFAGAHTGVQAGPLVILTASDTGTGMKPEVKAAGQSAVRSASFRRLPHRCAPESHPPVASGASGGPEMLSTAAAAGPEPRS